MGGGGAEGTAGFWLLPPKKDMVTRTQPQRAGRAFVRSWLRTSRPSKYREGAQVRDEVGAYHACRVQSVKKRQAVSGQRAPSGVFSTGRTVTWPPRPHDPLRCGFTIGSAGALRLLTRYSCSGDSRMRLCDVFGICWYIGAVCSLSLSTTTSESRRFPNPTHPERRIAIHTIPSEKRTTNRQFETDCNNFHSSASSSTYVRRWALIMRKTAVKCTNKAFANPQGVGSDRL